MATYMRMLAHFDTETIPFNSAIEDGVIRAVYCVECKHMDVERHDCKRPRLSGEINLVPGQPYTFLSNGCDYERNPPREASHERQFCGPNGRFFEPKDPA